MNKFLNYVNHFNKIDISCEIETTQVIVKFMFDNELFMSFNLHVKVICNKSIIILYHESVCLYFSLDLYMRVTITYSKLYYCIESLQSLNLLWSFCMSVYKNMFQTLYEKNKL